MRAHEDQRGTARFGTRIVQRLSDSGKIVAVFTLLLLCVLLFTFGLATMLGMDLSL